MPPAFDTAKFKSMGEQFLLWGVLMQIASAVMAPVLVPLQQELWKAHPDVQLPLAELVMAVIKGQKTEAQGEDAAAQLGIASDNFRTLVAITGNPPGPETLLELWRRGRIEEKGAGTESTSVEQGIREGLTKNKWIEPLKELRYQLPAPSDALEALLEGQTDEATARDLYAKWGGHPDHFQLLFETRGSAPTPLEAAEMARRGIIPWSGRGPEVVSFEQAFLEGPWRNKWLDPYRGLSTYIPPPRTVTALIREGAVTDQQGLGFFQAAGLTPELAAAYVAAAHHQKTEADKQLAKGDVLDLYEAGIIPKALAVELLALLHYSAQDADWLLAYRDFKREAKLVQQAVARLRSLYLARKLSKTQLVSDLGELNLPTAQTERLLQDWDLERQATVQVLTAAEIGDLVKYGIMPAEEGLAELEAKGFTARDAWYRLAVSLHQPPTAGPPPA